MEKSNVKLHQCKVDCFQDFCFEVKTCRVKIISRKNDILREIIKNYSSKLSFLKGLAQLLIIFDEQLLIILH